MQTISVPPILRAMQALRAYLESKNLTQAQFADQMGVKQPTVCDWVNGKVFPSRERLLKIASITQLPLEELLTNKSRKGS